MKRYLPVFAVLGFLLVLVMGAGDSLIAKKVIAHLLMPAGLLWWLPMVAAAWPGRARSHRWMLAAYVLLYSLAGSPYLGGALLGCLEAPYYSYEQPKERLDLLVVLGGGTGLSPEGRPALGLHGDRITRPVILFHEGLVGTLVTTGRSVTEKGADRLLSRETSELWQGMGVSSESIIEVSEPRNTREELIAVAALVKEHPEWQRIGLCTSASHLGRSMAEAHAVGLDPVPVPSDFRSGRLVFSPLYLIPQGRGFRDVQTVIWEFLGRLV